MYPNKNPLRRIEDCPPFLAHALAREANGKQRIPLDAIVKRSGLSERTYLRTACKDSWDGVKYGVLKRFLKGCGVDPFNMRNHWRYLREHGFVLPYLTRQQADLLNKRCADQRKPTG